LLDAPAAETALSATRADTARAIQKAFLEACRRLAGLPTRLLLNVLSSPLTFKSAPTRPGRHRGAPLVDPQIGCLSVTPLGVIVKT
jgi:hypothetical protein